MLSPDLVDVISMVATTSSFANFAFVCAISGGTILSPVLVALFVGSPAFTTSLHANVCDEWVFLSLFPALLN